MALCINPDCSYPNHPNNGIRTHCQTCQAELILQGRYRVMRLITDTSGFGTVYEVFERDQPKILKVLKPAYRFHTKAIQLFQQEAIVLSRLAHPGVPHIDPNGYFQFTPVDGSPSLHCIVMEKIDGPNLSKWMQQQGHHPIGEAQALQWLQQLTEVLHLIHQQQFFHRDIKPENIMLRSSGQLVLVDFGAVREMSHTYFKQLASTGGITCISSAGYTPPEQERGQAVFQSDFYSLGCTFIYLLTAKRPLDGEIYNPLTNELQWRPFAPHISTEFADFIDQLTAERVIDRPTNTADILAALEQLQQRHLPANRLESTICESSNQPVPGATTAVSSAMASYPPSCSLETESEIVTLPPDDMGLDDIRLNDMRLESILDGLDNLDRLNHGLDSETIAAISGPMRDQSFVTAFPHSHSSPYSSVSLTGSSSYRASRSTPIPSTSVSTLIQSDEAIQLDALRLRHKLWWAGMSMLLVGGLMGGIWGWRSLLLPQWPQWQTQLTQLMTQFTAPSPLLFTLAAELEGHAGAINDLALSWDQRILVSGSNDRSVRVWDLVTGDKRELRGHGDRVQAVAISPNRRIVASGGGDIIKLWNPTTGEAIADLTGHTSFINALAVTPDGQVLVSAGADNNIKLWDLTTYTEITTLKGHSSFVNTISISPDGKWLASGAADNTIKLWDLITYEETPTSMEHESFINSVIFSLNGAYLISAGADNRIKIWDRTSHQLVNTLQAHTSFVNALGQTDDGQFLVSTSADQHIIVWDLNTFRHRGIISWKNTLVDDVVIRSTGTTWQVIAGGKGSNSIHIWNYDSRETLPPALP